jgi:hypothetical protein
MNFEKKMGYRPSSNGYERIGIQMDESGSKLPNHCEQVGIQINESESKWTNHYEQTGFRIKKMVSRMKVYDFLKALIKLGSDTVPCPTTMNESGSNLTKTK